MPSAPVLRADVHVSSRLPIAILRNGEPSSFSPISSTLIHGPREAVLVDTPISIDQTEELARWIKQVMPDKELKYIYITHGHGDHFFGVTVLKKYWPDVHTIATPDTVAHMKQQLEPAWWDNAWLKFFPNGQVATPVTLAEPLDSNTFEIDGRVLRIVEAGHTDTFDTTVLHVPELDLVVAGDAVYGDVHQYFGEAYTTEKRLEWLRAIDTIESLKPKAVIAGHEHPGSVDGVYYLQSTRDYIMAFEQTVKVSTTTEEIVNRMKALYPDRVNPHAIMAGALATIKQKEGGSYKTIYTMAAETYQYQVLITSDDTKAEAAKRRKLYIRPFFLFWLNSFIFEVTMLIISIVVFSGFRDMFPRLMWTIFFCPLGMGGAMGGLVNAFIVDKHYGSRAVHFCAIMSLLVPGACNDLCYNLDLVFGWFGSHDHFWWWHGRYPLIYGVGYMTGKLLFTDKGQEKLAGWGV
ncbi:metallo-beta-lactamase domain [Fusarium albosuccineum]|uniref:Metallo-beta-lactamase domain n=1 Tax=Fusarium albosuccineum TaxID=1237068 RepID=A0A8H4P952_9HYPO|nr:metallo-beta-lactamase domain [Fusarium albosuccineum]